MLDELAGVDDGERAGAVELGNAGFALLAQGSESPGKDAVNGPWIGAALAQTANKIAAVEIMGAGWIDIGELAGLCHQATDEAIGQGRQGAAALADTA